MNKILIIAVMAMAVCGCKDEEAEWQAFSTQHHCKIIDRKPGRSSMMMMNSGNSISLIPIRDKGLSTYQCDDQVVSRRED